MGQAYSCVGQKPQALELCCGCPKHSKDVFEELCLPLAQHRLSPLVTQPDSADDSELKCEFFDKIELTGELARVVTLFNQRFGEFPLQVPPSVPVQLANGSLYEGQWSAGLRHGSGTEWVPGRSLYIGGFKRDRREGLGRLVHASGTFYQGSFSKGLACGSGVFVSRTGAEYRGQFRSNLQFGKGTESYADGSRYSGEFWTGMKHGTGTFRWANRKRYRGQFRHNLMHGFGTLSWPDGRRYKGEWLAGKMHGRGQFDWPDGRRYRGQYFLEKQQGKGEMRWPSGQVYVGEWLQGRQHGAGTLSWPDEAGEWVTKVVVMCHGRVEKSI